MDGERVENELLAYHAARERRLLDTDGPAVGVELEGQAAERLADLIRPTVLRKAREAALAGGETERRRFRALLDPFLDSHSRQADVELEARRDRGGSESGYRRALVSVADPAERERLYSAWLELEKRLEAPRRGRREEREAAALAGGARGLTAMCWVAHASGEIGTFLESFERGAIAPLDAAVARAVHEARVRGAWSHEPSRRPARDALSHHAGRFPSRRVDLVLGELGAGLGVRRAGLTLPRRVAGEAAAGSRLGITPGGEPLIALQRILGPADWGQALGLWGEGLRLGFVQARCGEVAARFGDPAAGAAARTVFGRLLQSSRFLETIGVTLSEDLEADLRLREAVVPRRDWSYLVGVGAGPDEESLERSLERALAGPSTPDERRIPLEGDPWPASELRGRIWGLLLEDQLLLRFGTGWFRDRRALDLLCEIWEAEPAYGLDAMAADLGVGTIEPTPVVDRCRP